MYRVGKIFEFHAAHVLSKHKKKCRYHHGHTYKVEVVFSCRDLDENDMVCDFQLIADVIGGYIKDEFDHTIMINSEDKDNMERFKDGARVKVFVGLDPTSEVIAKEIFDFICSKLGDRFPHLCLEKVRVWETSSSYAEYSI